MDDTIILYPSGAVENCPVKVFPQPFLSDHEVLV